MDTTNRQDPAPDLTADPTADHALPVLVVEAFEAIWRGDAPGFSERDLRQDLHEVEEMLVAVQMGRTAPRTIIGRGATKARALEYLNRFRADLEGDLAHRGRTHLGNKINAYAHARDAVTDPRVVALKAEMDQLNMEKDHAWREARILNPDSDSSGALRHPAFVTANQAAQDATHRWYFSAQAALTAEAGER